MTVEDSPCVATLGSHSALQILKGARDEDLRNIVVAAAGRERLYGRYDFVDEIVTIPDYRAFAEAEGRLIEANAVLVPHGSFVAYLGLDTHDRLHVGYFGNKAVLGWEADRDLQRRWLEAADLTLPREYAASSDVDAWPVLAKRHRAPGGPGCFLSGSQDELEAALGRRHPETFALQEYVVGVTLYIHYFQSVLSDRLEILSVDRRYETNVDGLGRLPHATQAAFDPVPSYVVVGNAPLVLRESMLDEAYAMGERVVDAARSLIGGGGLWGPFCLETVITPDLRFHVIEISCRIVAGTNLFVDGSPYAALWFEEPMSTGRRIARELRMAHGQDRLAEVVDGGPWRSRAA